MPPPGSIPDPTQNPEEKQFGIIYYKGIYIAYNKAKDKNGNMIDETKPSTMHLRYLPFGFQIDESKITYGGRLEDPIFWNGYVIDHEVFIDFDPNSEDGQAVIDKQKPVTRAMYDLALGITDKDKGLDALVKNIGDFNTFVNKANL